VVVDGKYAKGPFLKPAMSLAMTVVSRLLKDAAQWTAPGPRVPGRRGSPRYYRDRRIELAKRAGSIEVGRPASSTCMARDQEAVPAVCGEVAAAGGAILVVMADEPGVWVTFFCTDVAAGVAEILATVADRFALESAFRDCKEVVGPASSKCGSRGQPSARSTSASGRSR
jgi:hypothetical protein